MKRLVLLLFLAALPASAQPASKPPDMALIRKQFAAKDATIAELKKEIAARDAAIAVLKKGSGTSAASAASYPELKRIVQDYNALLLQAQSNTKDMDNALNLGNDYFNMSMQADNIGDFERGQNLFQKSMDYSKQEGGYANELNDRMDEALSLYKKIKASAGFDQFYVETSKAIDAAHTTNGMLTTGSGSLHFIEAR